MYNAQENIMLVLILSRALQGDGFIFRRDDNLSATFTNTVCFQIQKETFTSLIRT